MRYVFLILFLIVSLIHIISCWKEDGWRGRTKPLLLLLLIGFYLTATGDQLWSLLLALITSWLGDVLLMLKGNKWFLIGGTSFFLAHIFFILTYAAHIQMSMVSWGVIIPTAIVFVGAAVLVISQLKDSAPGFMLPLMFLYLLANSTMNVFALMRVHSRPGLEAWTAFAGAVLFFLSDCVLFIIRFHRKKDRVPKPDVIVMTTYILAQLLIVLGSGDITF